MAAADILGGILVGHSKRRRLCGFVVATKARLGKSPPIAQIFKFQTGPLPLAATAQPSAFELRDLVSPQKAGLRAMAALQLSEAIAGPRAAVCAGLAPSSRPAPEAR